MYGYLGRIFSGLSGVYKELNPATLSGAIDVIVIKQEDGSFLSSPFHVRFGKSGILRPKEKMVDIYVNDELVPDIQMKLGEAGEAFFVEEVEEECAENVPEHLCTSPMPSAALFDRFEYADADTEQMSPTIRSLKQKERRDSGEYFIPKSSGPLPERDREDVQFVMDSSDEEEEERLPVPPSSSKHRRSSTRSSLLVQMDAAEDSLAMGALSDCGESSGKLPNMFECSSDTELEAAGVTQHPLTQTMQWEWGALPHPQPKPKSKFRKQLNYQQQQPEGELSVMSSPSDTGYRSEGDGSGSVSAAGPVLSMSLCGGLIDGSVRPISSERFMNHLVTYEEFMQNPDSVLSNPDLVIRMNDKYYNWTMAAPMLLSNLAFQTDLPAATTDQLLNKYMPQNHKKKRVRSWLFWGASKQDGGMEAGGGAHQLPPPEIVMETEEAEVIPDRLRSLPSVPSVNSHRKTTRLSSEQIAKMNLRPGVNEVTYSVTTQYQGTTKCTSFIYLWKWSDKLVISDIDGTITRSDVLGQVLPMVGKDWTQEGVAKLYSKIESNGYKFVYLSARAIGQSGMTRQLIDRIKQEGVSLPDGPILLSPISLIHAFANEVILKKPEEFKISCLKDLRALFPLKVYNPFHSGYGNKKTDVISYKAVEIPDSRIFTVNYRGELRNEINQTFPSSYNYQTEIVDHFYPPLQSPRLRTRHNSSSSSRLELAEKYSQFTYWKQPIPEISGAVDLP